MAIMKGILRWFGRHKVWAYFIITFTMVMVLGVFGFDTRSLGRIVGLFFLPYLFFIWVYSKL